MKKSMRGKDGDQTKEIKMRWLNKLSRERIVCSQSPRFGLKLCVIAYTYDRWVRVIEIIN